IEVLHDHRRPGRRVVGLAELVDLDERGHDARPVVARRRAELLRRSGRGAVWTERSFIGLGGSGAAPPPSPPTTLLPPRRRGESLRRSGRAARWTVPLFIGLGGSGAAPPPSPPTTFLTARRRAGAGVVIWPFDMTRGTPRRLAVLFDS